MMSGLGAEPTRPARGNQGIWVILVLAAIFFAIVIALLVSTGKEPRPEVEPLEDLFVVPTSLRLRTEPNLEAPIVANLDRGEKLEQLAQEGSWVQVRREDGTIGWAERTYLETETDHERRVARYNAIRLLPPLEGEVERKVALHSGPGVFFPVIGELERGTAVTVYTRDHDFYAVEIGGEVAFAEVDSIDLSEAGAALFEVAASDEDEPEPRGVPPLTASLPEQPPIFLPPIDEPEPPRPIPPAEPEPAPTVSPGRGGVYPGVPPGGTDPIVIDRAIPRYPAAARANGVEGTVVVRAVVRRNGRVGDVEILKDLPNGLGEAAASAVRRWRFRPATYEGRPIDVYYNVTVNFRLSD